MNRRSLLAGLFALPTAGLSLPVGGTDKSQFWENQLSASGEGIAAGTITSDKITAGSLSYDTVIFHKDHVEVYDKKGVLRVTIGAIPDKQRSPVHCTT